MQFGYNKALVYPNVQQEYKDGGEYTGGEWS